MNATQNLPYQVDPVQSPNKTPEDEISLLDILGLLVRNRNLILSVTAFFTLLSVGYALTITPMYRATIGFSMPQEIPLSKSVATKDTTEIESIINETKMSLYHNFLMEIQSYNFQREVFNSGNFLEKFVDNPNGSVNSDAVVLNINKSITLTGIPATSTEFPNKQIYMEMKGSKPEGMAKFFNALVETGIKNIPIKDLLSDAIDQRLKTISSKKEFFLLQEEKKRKMKVLQNKMTVLQNKKKFEKEISILKEELALARGMKIEGNNFKTDQPLNGAPRWYLYGARILEEELKVLESKAKNNNEIERVQTNSTIEQANLDNNDIKTLNAEIERAQTNSASEQAKFDDALKIWESFKNLKSPTVVVINQASIPPTQPIQTKKAILIFTAMIVGLVLGCFIAIIRDAMRKLKEKEIVFAPAKPDRKFVFEHSSQAANLSRAR